MKHAFSNEFKSPAIRPPAKPFATWFCTYDGLRGPPGGKVERFQESGYYHAVAFVAGIPISLGIHSDRRDAARAIVEAHCGSADAAERAAPMT